MGQQKQHNSVQYVSWEGHYSEALSFLMALQALITHREQEHCQIPKGCALLMGHCSRGGSTRVSAMGSGDLSPPRPGDAKLLGHWV